MLKWFTSADRGVDLLVRWITLYGILSGGLSWLAKNAAWFGQLTWSQSILVGMAAGVVLFVVFGLSLAASGWGYRKWKPLLSHDTSELSDELGRVRERLKRAEERLDGAKVDEATGHAAGNSRSRLTEVDKERCAKAFEQLNDFIMGDLKRLYQRLGVSGGAPNKLTQFFSAIDEFQSVRTELHAEIADLIQRHSQYYDLVDLDAGLVLRGLDSLNGKLGAAAQAKNWPTEVQIERARNVAAANGQMWSDAMAVMQGMREKRIEYINS